VLAPLEYMEERDREDQMQVGDVLAEPVDDEGTNALFNSKANFAI